MTSLWEGLIAYYPFDGDANDVSGNSNDGAVYGAVLCNGYSVLPNNYAYCFNGIDNYIKVANTPLFNDITSELSISAWIKPSTTTGARIIVSKWNDFLWEHSFIFKIHNNNDKLRISLSKGNHYDLIDLSGAESIIVNTWTYVAAVYGSDKVRLYVNGVEDSVGDTTGGIISGNTIDLLIGAGNCVGNNICEFFEGGIDELRIYNRAITPLEVKDLYLCHDCDKRYQQLSYNYTMLNKNHQQLSKEYDALNKSHQLLNKNSQQLSKEYDALNKSHQLLNKNSQQLSKEYDVLNKSHQLLNEKYDTLNKDHQQLNENSQQLSKEYDVLNKSHQLLNEKYDTLNKDHQQLNENSQQLSKEYDVLNKSHQLLNEKYDTLNKNYQQLNENSQPSKWYIEEWFWTMIGSLAGIGVLGLGIYQCCCKKQSIATPIAISLSTDKEIEVIKYENSEVCFKYDGHTCQKTSWVGLNDAILVYNPSGTTELDSRNIVFTEWGKDAKTDFQAMLNVFDSNHDGKFDDQDEHYPDFHIWQDKNSDGVVNEGELQSLKEVGIKVIDFTTTQKATPEEIEDGILNKAEVKWINGEVTTAYDLVFSHDL